MQTHGGSGAEFWCGEVQEAARFNQRFAVFDVVARPEPLFYDQYHSLMHPQGVPPHVV